MRPFLFGLALLGMLSARAADPQPYTRIDTLSPRHYRIEVAWRMFHAAGKPDILLAGMVHYGSPDFYVNVQELLQAQPAVLIEDINCDVPERPAATATDDEKRQWTKIALQFAGEMIEGYNAQFKCLPVSFDPVFFTLEPGSAWSFELRRCLTDGWGHAVAYRKTATGYEISSTGGGTAPDPALTLTHTATWRWTDLNENRVKNKDNLGLLDQSNGGLTFDHANFHFCDMLISEYNRRVQALPKTHTSPYFTARDAPHAFNETKYPNDLQVRRFLVLAAAGTPHLPESTHPEGEDHVTLTERNDVVWAEIVRRIATREPVCALYGAGHLYDIEERLVAQQGYTPGETRWLPVFDVDLSKSKITDAEIAAILDDARSGRMGYY